jgi:crotonobetainyl-CoA:carnitine CoA-transferase CaiB-like acyl-CoA transferase
VIATMLALIERDQSGGGRLVETVMVEAALNAAAEQVAEYGASGTVLRRDGNRGPVAAPQGVYPCAGDDRWLALAVVTDEQWQSLRSVIGDSGWAADIASTSSEDRRRNHDGLDAELARWTIDKDPEEVAARLVAAGVPACAVTPARDIVSNPQLRSRHLFEVEPHAVTGDHEIPMLPFRFSRVDHWLRSPAPTLGQHNTEVLSEIGLTPSAIDELRRRGIVGETLRGS